MSVLANHIRECLARYISGEVPLRDFQEWFAPRVWDVDATGDPEDVALAHDIELLVAEYTSGHWTESELRHELRQHANIVHAASITVSGTVTTSATHSAAAMETEASEFQSAGPVVVFVRVDKQPAQGEQRAA